jgi:molecular chaperone DnaK
LLEIEDGVFHVLATNGDTYLGGEDFDNRIVEWLVEEFWKEQRYDLSQDKLALQRIKEAAERAKRELSFTLESEITLPFICSAKSSSFHIKKVLSRAKLEELTEDLVKKTLPCIDRALEDARMSLNQIQEVILVGGQTRMPLIKKAISDFFGKAPIEDVNPDEIVAMGAAIQSGILGGKMEDLVLLLDVTAFSLGIETENDSCEILIERNTTIPTKITKPFTTVEHNQRQVRIHVLQGESREAHENKSLATFYLTGIEPAPAGVPQIDVTFEIDVDGLVRVHAQDKVSGSEQRIEVRPSSGLTRSELQNIIDQNKSRESSGPNDGK